MKRPPTVHESVQAEPSASDTERALLDLVRRGDITAFERLFRAYAADLADFAHWYVDSDDDAEEVVHVVFCWLWEHRATLPHPQSVRSYLYGAVRNRALNAVRDRRTEAAFRDRAQRAARDDLHASVSPSPESELAGRDIAHALAESLRRMPPRCREVYTLARENGLTYREIGEALGISQKTVEIHMSRALGILRQRLAPWIEG